MDSTEAPIYSMAVISFAASLSGFLLCISPLICQVSHRNLAASCLIGYMMISDAFYALNALIWSHGDVNSWWDGAGLCDIEVKIQIATQIALPGTLFCIFYTLADVMNTDRATLVPTRAERLRKQALEVTFCFVIPLVAMALHFICQPFRYGILGVTGCAQSFDESWVSFVLVYGWPPVICLLAAVYCGEYKRRSSRNSSTNITSHCRRPPDQIQDRVLSNPRLHGKPHERPPFPAPLLAFLDYDPDHPAAADMGLLHSGGGRHPLPPILLGKSPRAGLEHYRHGRHAQPGAVSTVDLRRGKCSSLPLLRFEPRVVGDVPPVPRASWAGSVVPLSEYSASSNVVHVQVFFENQQRGTISVQLDGFSLYVSIHHAALVSGSNDRQSHIRQFSVLFFGKAQ